MTIFDNFRFLATAVLLLFFAGCCPNTQTSVYPKFPDKPSREAYDGFEWEEVTGAGLRFWAQRNENIQVVTDSTIPGALIEWDGMKQRRHLVIQLFTLKNKSIEDLLKKLQMNPDWDHSQTCRFEEMKCNRKGVKRYILTPTGEYAETINKLSSQEPIPTTCNGWGVGNSGMRYFEIHENCADRAIFVEIGQDAPIFDEQSIVMTAPMRTDNENDSLMIVKRTAGYRT